MKTLKENQNEAISEFIDSFSEFEGKLNVNGLKVEKLIENMAVLMTWEEDLNIFHALVIENEHIQANSSLKSMLQENIDNLVAAWGPLQDYEENPADINTTSYINHLRS